MKKEVRNFSCIWKCCIDLGCDLDFTYYVCIFNLLDIDSMVDTFYAIGLVMRLCQLISLLELLHIYVGIESNHLLPRFLQLTERIIILFVVITSQEEVQEKYVVCVLFIFWNLLDMVRYTYSMLSVIGISYVVLTWLSQTLWMPIYPLCVLAEGMYFTYSHLYSERRDILKVFPVKKKKIWSMANWWDIRKERLLDSTIVNMT